MKDRTQEFKAYLESLVNRQNETTRLFQQPKTPSQFTLVAKAIGREISQTMLKLEKLAQLAKKKTLFDDKSVEINELIYIIKKDIATVKQKIDGFSSYVRQQPKSKKQVDEHESNVITSLQSKLADTGNMFKDILEVRSQNMKEQKERRDQYTFANNASNFVQEDSSLYNPIRQRNVSSSNEETIIDIGFSMQQQQMSSVNQEIIRGRDEAITTIESTIAELGTIYQQFTSLLAQQAEQVQRIGDNVLNTEMNVENAHGQLVQYYQSISSNRWLMIKIFGVVIFFFLIFIMFMN